MEDDDTLWRRTGLTRFQVVDCVVTGHRGRYGVEVTITSPVTNVEAFIDFVLLSDAEEHVPESKFPTIGTTLQAVTLDFMPSNGELRLSAKPSAVARRQKHES